jgi:hypothetical protein
MSERVLEGRFLGFCPTLTEESPNSFWFQTLSLVERIYVPEGTNQALEAEIHKGQRARIWVDAIADRLTARLIVPLQASVAAIEPGRIGKIQICMHKNCCQGGARELKCALERALAEHPQGDQIVLEPVGCMDHCKKGPNVRILPVNRVYHRMTPIGMIALLHRYFPKRSSSLTA